MARTIDLNSDLGEAYGDWRAGDDGAMLQLVTSANIACGGHAGDPDVMARTLALARDNGVVVGAHPGYADLSGFGRRVIPMEPSAIERMVAAQIGALCGVAALVGTRVRYVKAHGALANLAADEAQVARAIARATRAISPDLALLAIAGTELELAGRDAGLETHGEVFADRAYLSSGRLVPRSRPGALLHDPDGAAARLLQFLDDGLMPTLDGPPVRLAASSVCVHGDNPSAVAMARSIRGRLEAAGIVLRAFLPVGDGA